MKVTVYISTYPWSVDTESVIASHHKPLDNLSDGEKRYCVDVEVPDRLEQLPDAIATEEEV